MSKYGEKKDMQRQVELSAWQKKPIVNGKSTLCKTCGFPMVYLMTSKPNSSEMVYYCFNCGKEEQL